jgi:hypothetical protein
MTDCNCTSAFTYLGRLFIQIDHSSYIEIMEGDHVCVTETCICSTITTELDRLYDILDSKGHFHFSCNGECCRTISSREEMIKVIDLIAQRRCKRN